jgi:hypothetical protein
MNLARTLIDLGQLAGTRRQAGREEELYRRAIKLLDEVKAMAAMPPDEWQFRMVAAYQNLAGVLMEGQQGAKAAAALREAIRHQRAIVAREPGAAAQHELLASYYVGLLTALQLARDHAGASKCAAEYTALLREMGQAGWRERVRTAGVLARCVRMVEDDKAVPAAQRPVLARTYGDEAMALLKDAVARGYRDVQQLQTAAAFQSLEGREDFRALLRELRSGDKGAGKP